MDASNIPIITIRGRYFYQDGQRFIARGIVYHLRGEENQRYWDRQHNMVDPLDDARFAQLVRDVEALKELNVNCLWIHNHNPDIEHMSCMDYLARNEIYVIFQTTSPSISINRKNPAASYNEVLLRRFSKVIDSVAKYRNTLGVCVSSRNVVGQNVPNDAKQVCDIQARVIRDMKQYMRYKHHTRGQRTLPLCVNDAQWAALKSSSFQRLADIDYVDRVGGGRIDFYCFVHYYDGSQRPTAQAVKTYRAGRRNESSPSEGDEIAPRPFLFDLPAQLARYDDPELILSWEQQLPIEQFESLKQPIPVLISEYGNVSPWLNYNEVRLLYGRNMTSHVLDTISGGFAYEFMKGLDQRGMVTTETDGSLRVMAEFHNFRDAMEWVTRTSTPLLEAQKTEESSPSDAEVGKLTIRNP